MKTSLSEELPILVEKLLEAAEVSLKFGEFDEVFLEKKSKVVGSNPMSCNNLKVQ